MQTYKVFFTKYGHEPEETCSDSVFIRPIGTWNDFGFQTLFEYRLSKPDFLEWLPFKIALTKTEENPLKTIIEILNTSKQALVAAVEMPDFISIQLDVETYEHLIDNLGLQDTRRLLAALGDIVLKQEEADGRDLFRNMEKNNVVRHSLFREDDTYNAFFEAPRLLKGGESLQVPFAPSEINFPFSTNGTFKATTALSTSFNPDGIYPLRIAVLVGKNGVGKSSALKHICDSYMRSETMLKLPPISTLVVLRTEGGALDIFPEMEARTGVGYRLLDGGLSFDESLGDSLASMIYRVARLSFSKNEKHRSRAELFEQAVRDILDVLFIVPVQPSESVGEKPVFKVREMFFNNQLSRLKLGVQFEPNIKILNEELGELSSGDAALLKLTAQLVLNVQIGSLVIIDEPETHLHPNYVAKFMEILNKILSYTKSVAIIATHSPYIVREVPAKQVQILRKIGGLTEMVRPRLKTLGADISKISSAIFGDELIISGVLELVKNIRRNPTDWETELHEDLSVEAVMYIRSCLED